MYIGINEFEHLHMTSQSQCCKTRFPYFSRIKPNLAPNFGVYLFRLLSNRYGSWQTYVNLDTLSKYMYGTNFIMKLLHRPIIKSIDKMASIKHQKALWPSLWCQPWNSHPKMFCRSIILPNFSLYICVPFLQVKPSMPHHWI